MTCDSSGGHDGEGAIDWLSSLKIDETSQAWPVVGGLAVYE